MHGRDYAPRVVPGLRFEPHRRAPDLAVLQHKPSAASSRGTRAGLCDGRSSRRLRGRRHCRMPGQAAFGIRRRPHGAAHSTGRDGPGARRHGLSVCDRSDLRVVLWADLGRASRVHARGARQSRLRERQQRRLPGLLSSRIRRRLISRGDWAIGWSSGSTAS